MPQFSTRDTIKAVAALNRSFDKVQKALDGVPLKIIDRGSIDTILVKAFEDQSKDIIMGNAISAQVVQQAKDKDVDIVASNGSVIEMNELSK